MDSDLQLSCPMGIAFTPDGNQAYINYQCAPEPGTPGHDPIFVFDAKTDRYLDAITRLSSRPGAHRMPNVGGFLAISPDVRWVWADGVDACSNVEAYDAEGCPIGEAEAQQAERGYVDQGIMNIIDIRNNTVEVKPFPSTDNNKSALGASVPTFLPDGKVAVSTQSRILIYEGTLWDRLNVDLLVPEASNLVFTKDGRTAYVASRNKMLVYPIALVPETVAGRFFAQFFK